MTSVWNDIDPSVPMPNAWSDEEKEEKHSDLLDDYASEESSDIYQATAYNAPYKASTIIKAPTSSFSRESKKQPKKTDDTFKYGLETREDGSRVLHGRQVKCDMCKCWIDGGVSSRTFAGIRVADSSTSSCETVTRIYCSKPCRRRHREKLNEDAWKLAHPEWAADAELRKEVLSTR